VKVEEERKQAVLNTEREPWKIHGKRENKEAHVFYLKFGFPMH